jgi:hypothetical protein
MSDVDRTFQLAEELDGGGGQHCWEDDVTGSSIVTRDPERQRVLRGLSRPVRLAPLIPDRYLRNVG